MQNNNVVLKVVKETATTEIYLALLKNRLLKQKVIYNCLISSPNALKIREYKRILLKSKTPSTLKRVKSKLLKSQLYHVEVCEELLAVHFS